jgi:hypothetical protein
MADTSEPPSPDIYHVDKETGLRYLQVNGEFKLLPQPKEVPVAPLPGERSILSSQALAKIAKDGYVDMELMYTCGRKPIHSFEEWTKAFADLALAIVLRHPTRAASLLGYLHLIGKAHETCALRGLTAGWREYDRLFRLRAGEDPTLDWTVADLALYTHQVYNAESVALREARLLPIRGSAGGSSFPVAPRQSAGPRVCFAFNTPRGCSRDGCQYAHVCQECLRTSGQTRYHSAVVCDPTILVSGFHERSASPRPSSSF